MLNYKPQEADLYFNPGEQEGELSQEDLEYLEDLKAAYEIMLNESNR